MARLLTSALCQVPARRYNGASGRFQDAPDPGFTSRGRPGHPRSDGTTRWLQRTITLRSGPSLKNGTIGRQSIARMSLATACFSLAICRESAPGCRGRTGALISSQYVLGRGRTAQIGGQNPLRRCGPVHITPDPLLQVGPGDGEAALDVRCFSALRKPDLQRPRRPAWTRKLAKMHDNE